MKYYSVELNTIEEVKLIKEKSLLFDEDGFMFVYTATYPNGYVSTNIYQKHIDRFFFRSKKLAEKELNKNIDARIRFHEKEIEILRKYKIK